MIKSEKYRNLYFDLVKKYNTLSLKYEVLKNQVKEDLFYQIIQTLNEKENINIYAKENSKMRKELQELKQIVFDNDSCKRRKDMKKCLKQKN